MKCSLGISNFLEEISSLSHSIVSLYFFALISEEGLSLHHLVLKNNLINRVILPISKIGETRQREVK